jgi:hypothetical protein
MTGRTRRGGRREISLARGLVLLAALVLGVCLVDVAEHVGLIILAVALGAGGFAAGRRYERGRRGLPAAVQGRPAGESQVTAARHDVEAADQLAELEQLAGRPLEAILATYQRVARYHHGGQQ